MTQFNKFIEISWEGHDTAFVNEMISLRLGCDKAKFMKKSYFYWLILPQIFKLEFTQSSMNDHAYYDSFQSLDSY